MSPDDPGVTQARGQRTGRPRLLAVGPGLNHSSYARVLHSTLGPLARSWDIQQLAINHRGDSVDCGWTIFPSRIPVDRYGVEQLPSMIDAFAPDAVFVFNSFTALPRYRPLADRLGFPRPVLIAQCPLLGEVRDPRLVGRLAFFDAIVVLSENVRRHFADCMAECQRIGMIDRAPRLEVIPHGVDGSHFFPLADRGAARASISALAELGDKGFVVLNANRMEARKRIDITLQAFSRFARDKPADVRLYLHAAGFEQHGEVQALIDTYGLTARILRSAPAGSDPTSPLDDGALNRLYNACDIGVNTASSEGWGMTSFEHAATGAAQIVPGSWVSGEIWRGHAELLDECSVATEQTGYTRQIAPALDSAVDALERLYASPAYRQKMAAQAMALTKAPRFQWPFIASQLNTVLRGLCGL
jgi:glycosyltransferase involved in cell wall biosynthesis